MRVPLSWLHDYVDPGLTAEQLADLLTFGGLEVEAVLRPSAGVRGVKVAEVAAVERLQGSDKLRVVEAFDGQRTWEVVAGAANYRLGDKVPLATPGAALPGGITVGRKQLFGRVSNGMLASAAELGVGDDHRGIWVLDDDAPLGAELADWLALDDAVLDVSVTPDRGYALSVIGLGCDVAALTGAELRLPDAEAPTGDPGVPVTIVDPDRCRRFDARTIRGVRVARSPAWLQRRLFAAGMRPVSNIVDATNHAMLETGNPVHAYDLALLAGPRIEVRTARPGEMLVTLDGVERILDPDDLVIADADGPVALAGVMGGEATEINDATADVLLEVANFSARTVLRSARRHRLVTEGSLRWERTVPAETTTLAATRCAALITQTAGGTVVGGADHYPAPTAPITIRLRPQRARDHLGMEVDDDRQRQLLRSIACEVVAEQDGTFTVVAPAYRPDLVEEADLYEEIARLHGYDRVPESVPSSGTVGGRGREDAARREVRRALAGGGWTEVLTFPFIADDDLVALGWDADDLRRRTIALVNPLSKEEAVLRTSLLPGLLRVVRHNVNRQTADVAVFEAGHVFIAPTAGDPGAPGGPAGVTLPAEPLMLGFAACGNFESPRHDRPGRPADLYDLLGAVDLVRRACGRGSLTSEATAQTPFHPGRAARLRVDGDDVGVVGELHPRVSAAFEVPERTLAGEVRLDRVVAGGVTLARGRVPSPLPGLRFDVAVVVDEAVPAAAVEAAVRDAVGERLTACTLFDEFRGPQLGSGRKSLAFALRVDDPGRQLTDADEAAFIDAVERSVGRAVGGQLRR